MATIEDFLKLDIRSGTIIHAELNTKARLPAYILHIDFGEEIGIKGSSAQITENYDIDDLIGTQVTAVMNFPPRRVAGFKSEVLVLAIVCEENGTLLVRPDQTVANGQKMA
ncbi:tRNA-binding protein [Algicola sagamiensis]|uniref:tRNA-binding protein n=1 Tax=Algicola sagamiensis TaxID=163869 RepID=UPI0003626F41|nr:tRNA-binding protein [Algicola sagamiensis]